MNIITDIYNGIYQVTQEFDIDDYRTMPVLSNVDDTTTFKIKLNNVSSIDNFDFEAIGLTDDRTVKVCYRVSQDNVNFTSWKILKNSPNLSGFDPSLPLYFEIMWIRTGLDDTGDIYISKFGLDGSLDREEVIGDGETHTIPSHSTVIWTTPYIYKAFRLINFDTFPRGLWKKLKIYYRYSQDYNRHFTNWEPLTKANISTTYITPLRFFYIEYKIVNDTEEDIDLQDIYLIGSFHNVSKDYKKQNLYGVRENCKAMEYGYYDENGTYIPNTSSSDGVGNNTFPINDPNIEYDENGNPIYDGEPTEIIAYDEDGNPIYAEPTDSESSVSTMLTTEMCSGNGSDISATGETNYGISTGSSDSTNNSNNTGNNGSFNSGSSTLADLYNKNQFNPYNTDEANTLLLQLSEQTNQIFGYDIKYFCTDPDIKGHDFTFHEYQLFNIVCEGDLKITVDGNNFPDSQIQFNQFNLDLFETMTVYIPKTTFKQVFGEWRRPSKEDIIFFCRLNRLFIVEHAQPYRMFNNIAVSYKVILKKYNQKANVRAADNNIDEIFNKLTQNSTIDRLFGKENDMDKKSAVKDMLHPLTDDMIRISYDESIIEQEFIRNADLTIADNVYNLSKANMYRKSLVTYKNKLSVLKESDNLSFMCWFKFIKDRYLSKEVYTFFQNYDIQNKKGLTIYLKNDILYTIINNNKYEINLTGKTLSDRENPKAFKDNTWYCYIFNLNQRQREISHYFYKRNADEENVEKISSTILKQTHKKEISNIETLPIFYSLSDKIHTELLGCDMKITNIRFFNTIIEEDYHHKIANQEIVGNDSMHLIFADNAKKHIKLERHNLN